MGLKRTSLAAAGFLILIVLTQTSVASAAEIKVLCSNGIQAVVAELAPQFEQATKHKVVVTYGLAAALKRQIESGEPFDLAVLTPPLIDDLIKQGKIAGNTRTVLARSPIALAIRAGAQKPDIRTVDALKRTLQESKSIAYAKEGASGLFFSELVQRLGLADALKSKATPAASGAEVGASVARGDAQLGVLPVSEILPVHGIEVLGAFPADVQGFVVMVAGSSSRTAQGAVVNELVKFLAAPAALPVMKKRGMELVPGSGARSDSAQGGQPPDRPAITVRGQTYTPRSILARNMGTDEDQTTAFPPHKVIGNIYYVGTRTLTSYLVTTPAGHILINSTYERNVRTIEKSVAQLGFKFADIRILLGTHAHGDHQEGDALVKELTGSRVMAMQEDVPALEAIKPGGKKHPIDRTLHDGDEVTLGGSTLVAHLTPGHTRGCTTWTMKAQEGGRTFNVVFACSYRAPATVTPEVENEFNRTFKLVRSLPCDVPLGDHAAQYNLTAKYARLKPGGPNPFVDPGNCWLEAEIQEAMLRAQVQLQQK